MSKRKKKTPPCSRCDSADTIALVNWGKDVPGRFQCLGCKRWFGPENPPDAGGTGYERIKADEGGRSVERSAPHDIDAESAAGRALRHLCAYHAPVYPGSPIVIGRRKTRPGAPYARLAKLGLARVAVEKPAPLYEPTDAGRALLATWDTKAPD